MQERLQKIISSRGIASRREAERLITEGRVKVNGKTAELGSSADPARDKIIVSGKRLPIPPAKVYIMMNKPRGYVTTVSDERDRKTVMDLLHGFNKRVYPVGRLDRDSEGLLILTNDGELTNRLMHPSSKIPKQYYVSVTGDIDKGTELLRGEMIIEGQALEPADVYIIRPTESGAVLSITIREGKNRQIRKMCEAAGLLVRRLRRVAVGSLLLGDLPPGKWRELNDEEIKQFAGIK